MIIAKSWKKIIKSYVGELESWREINHVLIFNKRYIYGLFYWSLNSMHYSAILKYL